MKGLVKAQKPSVLEANEGLWTEQFLAGTKSRPWSHPDIKDALVIETNEKCAYCESRLLAVSFGDIEHILPKSKFPDLVLQWENLTLACSRCNQHKGSKHEPALPFLNPYIDQIQEHILFQGPLAYSISDRGTYTVNELQLNEPGRVEARDKTLHMLESLIDRYEKASSEYIREQLGELIRMQLEDGEHTATSRSYFTARNRVTELRLAAQATYH